MAENENVAENPDVYVAVTGYIGRFGEANLEGEILESSIVVRAPKWIGTSIEKTDEGVLATVLVKKSELPGAGQDPQVAVLEEIVTDLQAQLGMPLTGADVAMLRTVLADQKTKAGERDKRHQEDTLLAKLDHYMNPSLFERVAEESSEAEKNTEEKNKKDPHEGGSTE